VDEILDRSDAERFRNRGIETIHDFPLDPILPKQPEGILELTGLGEVLVRSTQ
jgi:hypothetical protein